MQAGTKGLTLSAHRDIDRHFTVFQNLLTKSENYLKDGNYHASAVYAEIAASYATENHAGLFVSHQLEGLLLDIGRKIANQTYAQERNARITASQRHVLHVLTEAMGIGGLTRMVWRWIQEDTDSCHSVVLTRQLDVRIPQALISAVKETGGKVFCLNDNFGNILTWSQDLRRIAASADFVILHLNNHDVIPLIAFADKRSMPPIIFLNHSDHKFWLGASISDVVADQRYSGAKLTQTRRGIDKSKCGLLPIVLPTITRKDSVAEAKAQIGLSQDRILLLSIARPFKYMPLNGYASKFNDLVLPGSILPVLEQHPKSALIVIGPEFTDRWEQANQTVQGRISALGTREDTAIFYQAADIYLDSFPFGSITSCLEAGSYGLPVVSCNPYSDASAVLCADTPALDTTILRVKDNTEFTSTVSHLIEDPDYRTRIGKDTQENILSVHTGDNWKRYLQDLYQQAANAPAKTTINNEKDQKTISEVDIFRLDIDSGKISEDEITKGHIRLLPIDLRMDLWLRIFKQHHVFKPSLLLSEWFAIRLMRARASIRKIVSAVSDNLRSEDQSQFTNSKDTGVEPGFG
jgi:hypothetical protein